MALRDLVGQSALGAAYDGLQAVVLLNRRGNAIEKGISTEYLSALNEAYTQFFYYYEKAPLLIVNATEIDLVDSDADYKNLVEYLLTVKTGKHYFNPAPQG